MYDERAVRYLRAAAVLLDLDGTLVDSGVAVERAWRRWAGEYGIDRERVLRVGDGRRTADTVAELVSPEERERAIRRIDELELADVDGVVAWPGAAELMSALDGYRWAIVTSCGLPLMRARLGAAGLPVPAVAVTAGDVAVGKPDPAGYTIAARRLGVDSASCVVIEDAPAGVTAGSAAGATVIAVTTGDSRRHDELSGAHLVVPSLEAISGPSSAPEPGRGHGAPAGDPVTIRVEVAG